MVMPLVDKGVPVIGAHIGLDVPNERAREAWRFLIGYVEPADAYVFSRRSYTWEGLDESKVTVIARRSTPSRRRTTRCRSRR
jgi:hypothetical protein